MCDQCCDSLIANFVKIFEKVHFIIVLKNMEMNGNYSILGSEYYRITKTSP